MVSHSLIERFPKIGQIRINPKDYMQLFFDFINYEEQLKASILKLDKSMHSKIEEKKEILDQWKKKNGTMAMVGKDFARLEDAISFKDLVSKSDLSQSNS